MTGPLRVAITGANGFIGRALADHLAAMGHATVCLARRDGVIYTDIDDLARRLDGAHAVVHLAARAHQQGRAGDFNINQEITHAVCQAARRVEVSHLVYLSSIGVNGNATCGTPFRESDLPIPLEPYALSKMHCEQIVKDSGLAYTLVRPSMVYGPGAPGNFSRLLGLVRSGWPLPLQGTANQRNFLALDNLLDVLVLCLSHPAAVGELFLAADVQTISTQQLVEAMARGLDRHVRLFTPPGFALRAAAAMGAARTVNSLYGDLVVDTAKLQGVLGWRPRTSALTGIERASRESAL
jgi:nucleoside-diphosphate-sugar epimerase